MVDKNQAVIDFLLECPAIQSSPLYFQFINAKDDNKQIVTIGNERLLHRPFIDGSIAKRYTFTVIDFKSITYNAIPKGLNGTNENVEEMFEVQSIIDWVDEQATLRNYPDFGEDCEIDDIRALSDNPNLNGVDTSVQPALAKYSVSIQIDYTDNSKLIWK